MSRRKNIQKLMDMFLNILKEEYKRTNEAVPFRQLITLLPPEANDLVPNPGRAIDHQLRNNYAHFVEKIKKGREVYLIPKEVDKSQILETKIEAPKTKEKVSKKKFSELSAQIIETPIKDFIKKADFIPIEDMEEDAVLDVIAKTVKLTLANALVENIIIVKNNLEKFRQLTEEDIDYVIYWDESSGIEYEKLKEVIIKVAKEYNINVKEEE